MGTTFKSLLENFIASSLNRNLKVSSQMMEKLFERDRDKGIPDFDAEYERLQIDRNIFELKTGLAILRILKKYNVRFLNLEDLELEEN